MKSKKLTALIGQLVTSSRNDSPSNTLRRWAFCVLISSGLVGVGPVLAEVLTTMDFESGNFSGWTAFSTANGTLGGSGFPLLALCDHAGTGTPSRCLQVQVGQLRYTPVHKRQQGGGIELTKRTVSGILHLSARVGTTYHSPNKKRNLNGGLFEWVVDDRVVAVFDVGPIESGAVVQDLFTGKIPVTAGLHSIQLRITRPFQSGTNQPAPVQFVDDVIVELLPQS